MMPLFAPLDPAKCPIILRVSLFAQNEVTKEDRREQPPTDRRSSRAATHRQE